MSDLGLTHVALPVRDLDRSLVFYARFAAMQVVHERAGPEGARVAWISDKTRPFVIVLIEVPEVRHALLPIGHLGVGLASRKAVDALVERARDDGLPVHGPIDSGPPVGYWAMIPDPDDHTLEISHGQEVALTVTGAPADRP